jgi:hypothetical protein
VKAALRWAYLCALDPERAAAEAEKPETLRAALTLWALWVAASMLFTLLKPAGFPEPEMAGLEARPPLFWLRVLFWQPVLAAVLVGFVGVALRWLSSGWLALKLATGVAFSVAPFLVAVAYRKFGLPPAAASLFLAAWLAVMVWFGRRIAPGAWSRTAAVVLGLNGISLLSLAVEAVVLIPLDGAGAYKALMIAVLLWVLAAAARAFKRTESLSTPRALAAVFFALLAQNIFVGVAYLFRWLPLEVLKVLMYA